MADRREIRAKARKLLGEVCEANGLDNRSLIPAEQTVNLVLSHLDLTPIRSAPDSAHLHESLAVLEDDVVYINDDLEGGFRHYCLAHEAGHHVLHSFKPVCDSDDIGDLEFDDEAPTAKSRVVGYGPKEKKEREANLFALELLLPCGAVRRAFCEDGLSIEGISERTGMPAGFVRSQMARAVLIPETGDRRRETGDRRRETKVRTVPGDLPPGRA